MPTLVDVYLDARPTDRLRAFVLGRMTYDPFLSTTVGGTALPGSRDDHREQPGGAARPGVALVRHRALGVRHRGRQHVKWGVRALLLPDRLPRLAARATRWRCSTRGWGHDGRAADSLGERGLELHRGGLFEPTQNVGGGYSGSSSVENPVARE
jgi:hypothetical protein